METMSKRRGFAGMIGSLALLGLAACTRPYQVAPPPAFVGEEEFGTPSPEIAVNIFLDASQSMEGYTASDENSFFFQTIDKIESSFSTLWPRASITYAKFGADISPISRDEFLRGRRPGFYNEAKTRIENVIDEIVRGHEPAAQPAPARKAGPTPLSIIITDLFQNDADTVLLSGRLYRYIIEKKMAVGLVGIRSAFSGQVYEVGMDNRYFSYASSADPESQRPFYILVLGRPADLEYYLTRLDAGYLAAVPAPAKNFLVISSRLIKEWPAFDFNKIKSRKASLFDGLLKKRDLRVLQLKINHADAEEISVDAVLSIKTIRRGPEIDFSKFKSSVRLIEKPTADEDANDKAGAAVRILKLNCAPPQLGVTFGIDVKSLPSGRISGYQIDLESLPEAFKIPKWVNDWDLNIVNLPRWVAKPSLFPGNQTLNLRRFVDDLTQSMVRDQKPLFSRMFIYIKRK